MVTDSDSSDFIVSGLHREQWHLSQLLFFRFAFCYIVLYFTPSVLAAIPGAGWLVNWYSRLWDLLVGQILLHFLSIDNLQAFQHPTGSGDTALAYVQQVLKLILALAAAIVWAVLDRHRTQYLRLNWWLRVLARYALAFALLSYAIAKIIPTQFVALHARQLAETYGQSSPMGLLWNFMGFSTPYTVFAGCAELLPAFLIIFRRTALLGSLIAFAVMLNIVMLNFCYDVPVKLYSLNLLLLSIFLILPDTHRLLRMFVMNLTVSPSDLNEPFFKSISLERAKMTLKFAVLAMVVSGTVHSVITRHRLMASQPLPPSSPLTSRGFHWVQEYPYNR